MTPGVWLPVRFNVTPLSICSTWPVPRVSDATENDVAPVSFTAPFPLQALSAVWMSVPDDVMVWQIVVGMTGSRPTRFGSPWPQLAPTPLVPVPASTFTVRVLVLVLVVAVVVVAVVVVVEPARLDDALLDERPLVAPEVALLPEPPALLPLALLPRDEPA